MLQRVNKRILLAVLVGFTAGVVWLVAVRFVTYQSDNVHYHANFALYINGEQDEFDNFTFYEEVEACVGAEHSNPKNRVHMHNHENHIVHVHDGAATWGHFFANLGYGLTNEALKTDDGVFVNSNNERLAFILNGEKLETISNRVIGDHDTLLINYGSENNETLEERFEAIAQDAEDYNHKHDPGGCSGDEELNFWTRLQRAIGIGNY
ncbi:hypothetical protein BH23PAT1_BH23PAT1_4720 [soil metagenome]